MAVRALFLNAHDLRRASPGEVIFAEGETGTHMYGIVEGQVELRKAGIRVAVLGQNDVFGERALIDFHVRDITAVAIEPTVLAKVDRYLFLFLVDKSPTFALDVMASLSERLRNYDNWVANLVESRPGNAEPE